jgi:hypothetical protein
MTGSFVPEDGIDWKLKHEANQALIEAAVGTGSGLMAVASDAEAIAGTSDAVALTPGNLVAAMAAFAFPIVMTKAGGLALGALSSANDTSGVALSASKTKAAGIYADTGGAALQANDFVRAVAARLLIGTAITGGPNASAAGLEGLLKFIVSANMGGNVGGVMGHLESAGTLTLTGSINTVKAAVAAFLDLAAGATVAASTVVSAFGVNPANFGTLTGRSAIIHVTNPVSGSWGSLFDLSGNQGIATEAAGEVNDKFGVIYISGTKYTFPLSKA